MKWIKYILGLCATKGCMADRLEGERLCHWCWVKKLFKDAGWNHLK